MATAQKYYRELKVHVATETLASDAATAAARFRVTQAFAKYHGDKLGDASLHAGKWGGARNMKFLLDDQETFDVGGFRRLCVRCIGLMATACCAHAAGTAYHRAAS